ncbi:MAG: DUF4125 family protein [Lachnospiraceae bacterium]|nr:DUF4125 family protein [Lachnospiraceae bacterium]
MNVEEILQILDQLFDEHKLDQIEPFLTEQLDAAYQIGDYNCCVTILNELIGFYRDMSRFEEMIAACERTTQLLEQLGLKDSIPYATTLLNIATALRAMGDYETALEYYKEVFPVYQKHMDPSDSRYAALYNNISLLYQEMGNYKQAVNAQNRALQIVEANGDTQKIAISHTNMGTTLLQMNRVDEALAHLNLAVQYFDTLPGDKDYHYSAALASLGQAYVLSEDYEAAREYYLSALEEYRKTHGVTESYYNLLDNLHYVEELLGIDPTPDPAAEGTASAENENDQTVPDEVVAAEVQSAVCDNEPDLTDTDISCEETGLGLKLAKSYYEQVLLPFFTQYAPECLNRMAIGLAGEGSDCLGFDDEISRDHDFGPGLCIWLTHADFETYGEKISHLYASLPEEFNGYRRHVVIENGRVGVFDMDRFFARYTGYARAEDIPDMRSLLSIPDEALLTVTNGQVFADPVGEFSLRRENFYKICSEEYWRIKIANSLLQLGQYGQYNYPRSMKRGDYVTAQVALYKYIEELYLLVHYVNHAFPPYYKWLKKSSGRFECLGVLSSLTNALADYADQRAVWQENPENAESQDIICRTIEYIALLILDELKKQGVLENVSVPENETFLEVYGRAILQDEYAGRETDETDRPIPSRKEFESAAESHDKDRLVNQIVQLEWAAFDAVQNEGGRASCQDDWATFSIMRKSQYQAWPEELLISYMEDFLSANARNWNLITEKYGRMMISTNPEGYAAIKDQLPNIDETQGAIIEQIVSIQVAWMEQFAARYPYMAANSRTIHTSEDTPYDTSYETYLRGELGTYSKNTLKLYGQFIVELRQSGANLAEIIMTNTALLYGYSSLQDVENALCAEKRENSDRLNETMPNS